MTQTVDTIYDISKMDFVVGNIDMTIGLASDRLTIAYPNNDTNTLDGGNGSSVTMVQSNKDRATITISFLSNSPSLNALINLCKLRKYGYFQGVIGIANGEIKNQLNTITIEKCPKTNFLAFGDEPTAVEVILSVKSINMDALQSSLDQGLETAVEFADTLFQKLD